MEIRRALKTPVRVDDFSDTTYVDGTWIRIARRYSKSDERSLLNLPVLFKKKIRFISTVLIIRVSQITKRKQEFYKRSRACIHVDDVDPPFVANVYLFFQQYKKRAYGKRIGVTRAEWKQLQKSTARFFPPQKNYLTERIRVYTKSGPCFCMERIYFINLNPVEFCYLFGIKS